MSPRTCSARPYMGEESTTRPPSLAKSASTSSSGCRSAAPGPTSNTCHVPRPTTGSFSPDDGMARSNKASLPAVCFSLAARAVPVRMRPAAPWARRRAASLRDIWPSRSTESISELIIGAGKIADVGQAARHDYVAAQFSLVPLRDKDAAVVREAAGEGAQVNFSRGPVVITLGVFGIEGVEPGGKVQGSGGNFRAQFDIGRRCARACWVDRLAAIGSAASGEE